MCLSICFFFQLFILHWGTDDFTMSCQFQSCPTLCDPTDRSMVARGCQEGRMKRQSVSYIQTVVSNCLETHRLQPTRLLCPWDSPGKNTGVGCHFLLQIHLSSILFQILFPFSLLQNIEQSSPTRSLFICFKYSNVYMSILNSLTLPSHHPFPLVTISLFSMSVSWLLFHK